METLKDLLVGSTALVDENAVKVSLIADMDVEGRSQADDPDVPRVPAHSKIEIDPSVYPQSRNDWAFVVERLDAAIERGEAIDDELIKDIAAHRQQLASETYSYRTGAGATLESSTRVVESVVELYLLGTEASGQDRVGRFRADRISDGYSHAAQWHLCDVGR
jgi:hypothetical protein